MKNSLLILVVIFIYSCNNKETVVDESKFPPILVRRVGALKHIDNTLPLSMNVLGDKFVVCERYDYPFIKVYELPTFNKVVEFGSKKSASCALSGPRTSGIGFSNSSNEYLYVNDFPNNEFIAFDLKTLNPKIPVKPIIQLYLPNNFVLRFNRAEKVASNKYIINYSGNDRRGRFAIYDAGNKATKWIPYLPKSNEVISSQDMPFYYYSFTSSNDNLHVMGAAMKFFKRVEFYDSNGILIKANTFKPFNNSLPAYTPGMGGDLRSKAYYNAAYAGRKYFYCACIDDTQGNYNNNIGHMQIQVFDWQGELKRIIELDNMYFGSFAVDEKSMQLYIISYKDSDKQYPVIQYDLKNANL